METKSIGAFIASLRKEKQITQQELAEVLNVSNKTVSRWETGEGTPDISLIPVIADYFNLTCDELLRGERLTRAKKGSRTLWYCRLCLVVGTLSFFLCATGFRQYIVAFRCYSIGFVLGVFVFVRCYLYQEQKIEDRKKTMFSYIWMCIMSISIVFPYILMESYYVRLRSYVLYWVALLPILYCMYSIVREFVYEYSGKTKTALLKLDAIQIGSGLLLLVLFDVLKDCSIWVTVIVLFFCSIFNIIWIAILLSRYHMRGIEMMVPTIRNLFIVVGGFLIYHYGFIEKPVLLLPIKQILGAIIGYVVFISALIFGVLFRKQIRIK